MFRIAGISFDHMHMGDLLRMVHEHPGAEISAIWDPDRTRMASAIANFGIPEDRVFTDLDACLAAGADMALLCAAPAKHAEMTERLAPHGLHLFVEKPGAFEVSSAEYVLKNL